MEKRHEMSDSQDRVLADLCSIFPDSAIPGLHRVVQLFKSGAGQQNSADWLHACVEYVLAVGSDNSPPNPPPNSGVSFPSPSPVPISVNSLDSRTYAGSTSTTLNSSVNLPSTLLSTPSASASSRSYNTDKKPVFETRQAGASGAHSNVASTYSPPEFTTSVNRCTTGRCIQPESTTSTNSSKPIPHSISLNSLPPNTESRRCSLQLTPASNPETESNTTAATNTSTQQPRLRPSSSTPCLSATQKRQSEMSAANRLGWDATLKSISNTMVQQVLSLFPDADHNWVRANLCFIKLRFGDQLVDRCCNFMFEHPDRYMIKGSSPMFPLAPRPPSKTNQTAGEGSSSQKKHNVLKIDTELLGLDSDSSSDEDLPPVALFISPKKPKTVSAPISSAAYAQTAKCSMSKTAVPSTQRLHGNTKLSASGPELPKPNLTNTPKPGSDVAMDTQHKVTVGQPSKSASPGKTIPNVKNQTAPALLQSVATSSKSIKEQGIGKVKRKSIVRESSGEKAKQGRKATEASLGRAEPEATSSGSHVPVGTSDELTQPKSASVPPKNVPNVAIPHKVSDTRLNMAAAKQRLRRKVAYFAMPKQFSPDVHRRHVHVSAAPSATSEVNSAADGQLKGMNLKAKNQSNHLKHPNQPAASTSGSQAHPELCQVKAAVKASIVGPIITPIKKDVWLGEISRKISAFVQNGEKFKTKLRQDIVRLTSPPPPGVTVRGEIYSPSLPLSSRHKRSLSDSAHLGNQNDLHGQFKRKRASMSGLKPVVISPEKSPTTESSNRHHIWSKQQTEGVSPISKAAETLYSRSLSAPQATEKPIERQQSLSPRTQYSSTSAAAKAPAASPLVHAREISSSQGFHQPSKSQMLTRSQLHAKSKEVKRLKAGSKVPKSLSGKIKENCESLTRSPISTGSVGTIKEEKDDEKSVNRNSERPKEFVRINVFAKSDQQHITRLTDELLSSAVSGKETPGLTVKGRSCREAGMATSRESKESKDIQTTSIDLSSPNKCSPGTPSLQVKREFSELTLSDKPALVAESLSPVSTTSPSTTVSRTAVSRNQPAPTPVLNTAARTKSGISSVVSSASVASSPIPSSSRGSVSSSPRSSAADSSQGSVVVTVEQARSPDTTFQPTTVKKEDATSSVAELMCEACFIPKEMSRIHQCCEGHVICTKCVEKAAKQVLSFSDKVMAVCPCQGCSSRLPRESLQKALPAMILDLLDDKILDLQSPSNNVDNTVRCPSCDSAVVPEGSGKRFKCPKTCCQEESCRHCREPWMSDYCHQLCGEKQPGSTAGSVHTLDSAGAATPVPTEVPMHWTDTKAPGKLVVLKLVQPSSEEWATVRSHFAKTLPTVNIKYIHRVQNLRLWTKYTVTRHNMLEDNGADRLNERLLFHGTSRSVFEKICKEGFDWRMCGQHATAHGQGSYFASKASYSHRYSDYERYSAMNRNAWTMAQAGMPMVVNAGMHPGLIQQLALRARMSGRLPLPNSLQSHVPAAVAAPATAYVGQPTTPSQPASNINPSIQATSASSLFSVTHSPMVSSFGSNPVSTNPNASNQLSVTGSRIAYDAYGRRVTMRPTGPKASVHVAPPTPHQSQSAATPPAHKLPVEDPGKQYVMFLAKVLVGRSTLGRQTFRKPPVDPSFTDGRTFDSCVDNLQNPQIFVIFDSSQAYPEYVITYTASL